jgi:hypothetical protein
MKRVVSSLVVSLVLIACASQPPATSSPSTPDLQVTGGAQPIAYSVADLRALTSAKSSFKDVTYMGVPIPVLLADAGFPPASLSAVKAVASDGFSVTFDPATFQRQDVLVAYAQADGPLTADDGLLRMVVPDGEGKVNVRMLVELQVVP